jgi:Domain of unknown function (DUF4260)
MSSYAAPLSRRPLRPLWLLPMAALVLAAVALAGPLDWRLALGLIGPDAILLAAGGGSEPGRLAPRWVPAYNAAHHPAGPAGLAAAAAVLGPGALAIACAWGAHIAMDHAAGYGLRGADGWQRR